MKKYIPSTQLLPQGNKETQHVDLIRAIRQVINMIPITLIFTHIHGNQGNVMYQEDLNILAQMNAE